MMVNKNDVDIFANMILTLLPREILAPLISMETLDLFF